MKCPHCQTENEPNAIFCKNCNAWILGSVYVETAEPPVQETLGHDSQPSKRKKWWIPAIAGVVIMTLLAAVLLWPNTTPGPSANLPGVTDPPALELPPKQYVQSKGYITHVQNGEYLSILVDDKVLDTQHPFDSFQSLTVNLDCTAAVLLAENGTLSYVCADGISQLARNVIRCVLSVNGDGVAYMTGDGDLWLYRHSTNQLEAIVDNNLTFGDATSSDILILRPITVSQSFVISPDGASVACLIQNDVILSSSIPVPYTIHRYQNGTLTATDTTFPYSTGTDLLSISNDGCIYLLNADTLYAVDTSGSAIKLGTAFDAYEQNTFVLLDIPYCYLNADHTQLLYFTEEGTFVSDHGASGKQVSQQWLMRAMPQLTSYMPFGRIVETCPHLSFYDQIYYSMRQEDDNQDGIAKNTISTHYLNHNGVVREWAVTTDAGLLSPSGNIFYFTDDAGNLKRIHISSGSVTHIASSVRCFTVAHDDDTLYYVSEDGILYACDSTDGWNARKICEANTSILQTTRYGDVYWTNIMNYLDIVAPGQSEVRYMTDLERVLIGANGSLYIFDDTGLRIRTADGWDTLGQYDPPPILYG